MDIKAIIADALETQFRRFGFVPASERTDVTAELLEQTPHPVLTAALAVEIDTAEKFAGLAGEAKIGREALAAKRDYAERAAVSFFGDNKDGIDRAKLTIAATGDIETLSAMADTWIAASPGGDHPNQRSSTQAPAPDPTQSEVAASQGAPPAPTPPQTNAEVYANRRRGNGSNNAGSGSGNSALRRSAGGGR